MLCALGAEVVLASPRGERRLAIEELILGHYATAIEPDELLVRVEVPRPASARPTSSSARARSEDRPCVGVAGRARRRRLRVVVGAVADRPQILPEVCALADGASPRRAARGDRARATARASTRSAICAARPATAGASTRVLVRRALRPWHERARRPARSRYSLDFERPGMLHGRIVRSLSPHARDHGVELPGGLPEGCVLLTAGGRRRLRAATAASCPTRRCSRRSARYAGDPVAAVAAPDPHGAARLAARRRARRGTICRRRPTSSAALADGAPLVHDVARGRGAPGRLGGMRPLAGHQRLRTASRLICGRGEAGFDEADVVVEGEWTTASAQHAPMEPHACVAEWQDGRLTVWTGTQTPFNVRRELAGTFGLAGGDVRVVSLPMGGSFGAKTFTPHRGRSRPRSRASAGAPVKLVLSRDELFLTLNRHPTRSRVRLGATRDGRFVARRVWSQWDTGAYADTGPNVAAKGGWAAVGPYRFDHVEVDADCVYTNRPSNGAFRGYAATQAAWASEQCVDLLAERLGSRSARAAAAERAARRRPLRDGRGHARLPRRRMPRVRGARAIGWAADRRGVGLCALMKGMQTPSRAGARIELAGGALHRARRRPPRSARGRAPCCRSSLPRRSASIRDSSARATIDTDVTPFDTRTTSSRSTHMMAAALGAAAAALRQAVADELEAAPSDLRFTAEGERRDRRDAGLAARRSPSLPALARRGGARDRRRPRSRHRPGHRLGALAPGRRRRARRGRRGDGRRGDRRSRGLRLRRPRRRRLAGRAAERRLGRDGHRRSAVRVDPVLRRPGHERQHGRLPGAGLPRHPGLLRRSCARSPDGEIHGLGETALPLVPPALGNALQSLGLAQTHMPVHPERVLEALDRRDA